MVRTFGVAVSLVLALLPVGAEAAVIDGSAGADNLFGTRRADTINGFGGVDHLFGRGGNDRLFGGDSSDWLLPGAGTDLADGGALADTIIDDDGRATKDEKGDRLFGGPGNDFMYSADDERDFVDCGPDTDIAVTDQIDVVTGCETVLAFDGEIAAGYTMFAGTKGRDVFGASPGNDVIALKGGDDAVEADAGNDVVLAGLHRKKGDGIGGGPGLDALVDDDGKGGDVIFGHEGSDIVYAADGAPTQIDCGVDVDVVYMDLGIDTQVGCENVVAG